jgi:hypothetical protein
MATILYSFRPSLFASPRTIVIDGTGIAVRDGSARDRHVPWSDITEVHIEPGTAGDEDKLRWLAHLRVAGGRPVTLDSINVRGAADFEDKTDEFLAALAAIHRALESRADAVRFRFGARRGVLAAWRIALLLAAAVGIFGSVVAIVSEEYEALFSTLPFAALGGLGLLTLRGRSGPVPYDPTGFIVDQPMSMKTLPPSTLTG